MSEVDPGSVEREPELADLNLGTVVKRRRALNAVAVEVGAVERAEILDLECGSRAQELRVAPGHRDIVEKDVGLWVTADSRQVGVEQEARADVGAGAPRVARNSTGAR